ncbi:MAG: hypothetical protein AAF447_10550 [Myxococcota bacterium]
MRFALGACFLLLLPALPGAAAAQEPLRVAVVVRGDPAPTLREAARRLEGALRAEGVRAPSDPALRAALRGDAPPPEDDGYGRLRRLRRSLGFADEDARALQRLGRVAGADALAVVGRSGAAIRVEVFAVEAGAFFRGVRPAADAAPFVAQAAARARAAEDPTDTETETETETVPSPAEAAAMTADGGAGAASAATPPRPARRWFKRNWPYVVGAALLGGVVAAIVLQDRGSANGGGALLRFRPGPDEE